MPLKTYQDEQPVLNLTPMIDVLFLLIIFFMVGTKFAGNEKKIKLQLPSVGRVPALTAIAQAQAAAAHVGVGPRHEGAPHRVVLGPAADLARAALGLLRRPQRRRRVRRQCHCRLG